MSKTKNNYKEVIKDLEKKLSQLETTIKTLKEIINLPDYSLMHNPELGLDFDPHHNPTINSDCYLGMTLVEATRTHLEKVKKPLSSQDLASGLKQGGLRSKSVNFVNNINATLAKYHNSGLIKVNGLWTLKEWHLDQNIKSDDSGF